MTAVSLRDFVMTVTPAHKYLSGPTFCFNLPPRPVGVLIRIGGFIGASEWAMLGLNQRPPTCKGGLLCLPLFLVVQKIPANQTNVHVRWFLAVRRRSWRVGVLIGVYWLRSRVRLRQREVKLLELALE
jgi:hypothetical protein